MQQMREMAILGVKVALVLAAGKLILAISGMPV